MPQFYTFTSSTINDTLASPYSIVVMADDDTAAALRCERYLTSLPGGIPQGWLSDVKCDISSEPPSWVHPETLGVLARDPEAYCYDEGVQRYQSDPRQRFDCVLIAA